MRTEGSAPCEGLEIDFERARERCRVPPEREDESPAQARPSPPSATPSAPGEPLGDVVEVIEEHVVAPTPVNEHLRFDVEGIRPVPSGGELALTLRIVNVSERRRTFDFNGCIHRRHSNLRRHGGLGDACLVEPFRVSLPPRGAVTRTETWVARYQAPNTHPQPGTREPLPPGTYALSWTADLTGSHVSTDGVEILVVRSPDAGEPDRSLQAPDDNAQPAHAALMARLLSASGPPQNDCFELDPLGDPNAPLAPLLRAFAEAATQAESVCGPPEEELGSGIVCRTSLSVPTDDGQFVSLLLVYPRDEPLTSTQIECHGPAVLPRPPPL